MRRWLALGAGALLIGCAIVAAVLLSRGGESARTTTTKARPRPPRLVRVRELAARVPDGGRVPLRASPGGRVLATVGARTPFGSPQTMAVALRKGGWVAVRSTSLGNRRLGWAPARTFRLLRRHRWLDVDLSKRTLTLVLPKPMPGGERIRGNLHVSVAIGAPDTPTPPGEFYVTDKLRGADFGPYYGCCILALSGRQPNLPRGWSGGDRLAIHGGSTAGALAAEASARECQIAAP